MIQSCARRPTPVPVAATRRPVADPFMKVLARLAWCMAFAAAAGPMASAAAGGAGARELAQAGAAAEPERAAPTEVPRKLPALALSPQFLYQYLLAEVAAQRGRFDIATQAMHALARDTRDPRVAQRATELAMQGGLTGRAIEAAQLWTGLEPDSIQARQTAAALLVNAGRVADARPHLEKLLAAEGENIGQGFLALAQLFAKQPDRALVLAVIRELAAAHPKLPEARLAVAQAALHAGDAALGLEEARAAAALAPDNELAALFLAQLLARQSPAAAAEALRAFVARQPKAAEARLTLARLLVELKQFGEARTEFERLVADFPAHGDMLFAVAMLSLQLQDYEAADRQLQRLLEVGTKDPDLVRLYLGRAAESLKRWADALRWYGAVGDSDHLVAAQLGYAGVLARQGELGRAREALRRIVPVSLAQRVQIVLTEAQMLREARDFQGVFDVLGAGLEKTPDSIELLYDQALAAERLGRIDVLERNLRRVIEIDPKHAHAFNALGYTFADRNMRLDEALRYIDIALKLAPDDPYILDSMGWVYFRLGHNDKALAYLERAYKIKPDAEIAAHLGEVLWVQGRREEAKRIWARALESAPGNEVLQETVQRLLR
jgi:tetratricopeptide (TPR) repeat protein